MNVENQIQKQRENKMSSKIDTNERTFTADGAIGMHELVKVTATGCDVCGIDEHAIGTAVNPAFAAGDAIAVKLRSGSGTHKVVASAALAQGADAFTAASGKVGASASTSFRIGVLLEASSADGDVVEMVFINDGTAVA
tara:strand:+ start:680 stop:1096 length:417 start_codon:yes stop_codon:yes gene_type:complete